MAKGTIQERVLQYLQTNPPVENFAGTEAGFQQYKQQWVNDCTANNTQSKVGIFKREGHALGLCQSAFNSATGEYQMTAYETDAQNLQAVKQNNEKLQNTAVVALVLVLVIGLIVWLLTSA